MSTTHQNLNTGQSEARPPTGTQPMQIDTEDTNTSPSKKQKTAIELETVSHPPPAYNNNMELVDTDPTKSGERSETLKNPEMMSSTQNNKTTAQTFPRPIQQDIVFSPSNPYIQNSYDATSHADHQLTTD